MFDTQAKWSKLSLDSPWMGDSLGQAVVVVMGLDIDGAKRRRESAESVQPRHWRGKLPSIYPPPPGGSSLFVCPSEAELRQVAQPALVGEQI